MKNKVGRPKKLKADKVCFVGASVPPDCFQRLKDVMKAKGWTKSEAIAEMIGAFNV